MSLNNNKASAVFAADTDPTVVLVHGTPVYAYTGGGSGTKYGNTSCTTSTFPYSSFTYNGSAASTSPKEAGASYTVGTNKSDYAYKAAYESFTLKVTMPADKKYCLRITFSMSANKNSTNSSSSARTRAETFYFGNEEDKSSSLKFAIAHSGGTTPGNSSSYTLGYCQTSSNTTSSTSGTATTYITYDNSGNGSPREFESYFGFYAYSGAALNIHTQLTSSWSYSYEVLHNPIEVPTIAAEFDKKAGSTYYYTTEYTGEEQVFPFLNVDKKIVSIDDSITASSYVNDYSQTSCRIVGDDAFWNDDIGGVSYRYIRLDTVPATPKVVVDEIVTCLGQLPADVPLNKSKSQAGTAYWFPGRYEKNSETGEMEMVEEPASYTNPKWVFVPEDENYKSVEGMATIKEAHILDEDSHVEGVDATCTEDGSLEYWQCSLCNKYFSDEEGKTEISPEDVTVDKLGHNMTKVEAVNATCAAKGVYEHYDCSRCGGQFWDSEGNSACTASELVENELGHDCIDTVTLPTCT
ncbi:MAG: hypothetical protein K2G26_00720, partial [Clostridia bacterium]|nr:hypothetical protein [Clostridia bacterium]